MKKTYLMLLTAMLLTCCQKQEPGRLVFRLKLDNPLTTKVTLENPMSLYAAERLWKWEEGDAPSVIYLKDGNELIVPAASYAMDSSDPSVMKVSAGETPSGTSLRGAVFGSSSAYGKSCLGDEDIPSSMVYARATFSAIGEAAGLPDLTLKHQCSYFHVVPDAVDGNQMTSFSITGKGLKGGAASQTIKLSFKDSVSGEYVAKWIAVCNAATDVVVTATAGGLSYEMASFADAGKGKCNLYYIRNTSIGVEYQ